jgi:DNA repair protein RadA/Sms
MFVCQQCGSEQSKWMGRCPDCGEWNTLVETVVTAPTPSLSAYSRSDGGTGNRPMSISQVQNENFTRIGIPGDEFNRVLGGGIVPGSLVLIGGEPGIGKCVVGETRVLDPATGAYLAITEWAKAGKPVLALDRQTMKLVSSPVTSFHAQGMKPIVEVKTKLGRTLRCTPSHPLLTHEGWKRVEDLELGDYIAAPRALPYLGSQPLPESVVKLIAYILSDGSAQEVISVTTALPEVAADLSVVASYFGMKLVRWEKKGNTASQYRFCTDRERQLSSRTQVAEALRATKEQAGISWMKWANQAQVSYNMLRIWRDGISVPSRSELERLATVVGLPAEELAPDARASAAMKTPIAQLLEEIGLRFKTARDKAVPACIFTLPKEQLALFLKTLFTCDGSVYVNKYGTPGLSYSTISKRLAQDVQHLLLRFGFVTKLRTKKMRVNGQPYLAYEVMMLGVSEIKRFVAEIGIMGRGEALACIAAMRAPNLPSTHKDLVPTGPAFWQHIHLARGERTFAQLSREMGVRIMDRRHDRPLTRKTVQSLGHVLDDEGLKTLAHSDVYWDRIESITPVGEAQVYDITVPQYANFVANDLVIHNSTVLLQVASELALWGEKPVLYISGEESPQQIKLRAQRLGVNPDRLFLLSETDLDAVLAQIEGLQPGLVIVDSIQTMFLPDLTSAAGSVSQVRECTARLTRLAKVRNIPMFLVGHVTKEGAIAGPRVLEHMVDVVLYLEGDRFHQYRLLRGVKNRFGSTNEVGVFEMGNEGMVEVSNPSAAFLAERSSEAPGASVAVTLEGTRPILVEVQALTSATSFGLPRRTANGIDLNRLLLLTAVLSKRVGLGLSNQDIYINVVGGLKISEPAIDLAVAAAIASSYREIQVDPEVVLIGEVGLSGELRSVGQLERRLSEAAKLGFKRAVYPPAARKPHLPEGFKGLSVATLQEAIEASLVK